jgi:signal transduction histidine kinase
MMGILWARLMVHEIVVGVSGYAQEIAVDNFPLCSVAPGTWHRTRRVGRLDGYDASTLRSPNPGSPPLDPVLLGRLSAGEANPARVFWTWDGQWGGAVLTQLLPSGPCSLFQVSFRAPPGSGLRGLALLVILTVVSLAGTMALSTVVAVRPVVSRLVRLRRAAELVGAEAGYETGQDIPTDEIGRLATLLDRAHERVRLESLHLKGRQRALERHLGDIAHDLRTPLTSAHIALEQAARLLPDHEAGGLVRRALTETVYTAELTENLRLATQLREGGDTLEGDPLTNLAPVVERVVARFSLLGRHRGVALDGAVPGRAVFTRGHPLWAEQAVANVVHNAVTHGPEGTRVAVLLEVVRDAAFCITVVDDGPGVPPGELGRLAERSFRTSQARRRDPGGSGLGLAITAEICRRSGWTLRFEAERPRGLRVTIQGELA